MWLEIAEVSDDPVHLSVVDATARAQLAPLIQPDPGEIHGGHPPAALGQPDGVAAFARRQVKSAAGRQVGQFGRHELVRPRGPLELGARIALVPLLAVHLDTLPDQPRGRQLRKRARP